MDTLQALKLHTLKSSSTNWVLDFLKIEEIKKQYALDYGGEKEILSGKGVKVAVLDNGIIDSDQFDMDYVEVFDATSDEARNVWENIRYRPNTDKMECLAHTDLTGRIDNATDMMHGSDMAAYIGGKDGIAPQCDLLVINVYDIILKEHALPLAIYYAISKGAHIINISQVVSSSTTELDEAIKYAYLKNVPIMCSSGNSYSDDSLSIEYPAAFQKTYAIGGYTRELTLSPTGQRGRLLDLMGPSMEVPSLISGIKINSGTSIAAAVITGIITLFLNKFYYIKHRMPYYMELKEILLNQAIHPYGEIHDDEWGYGILHPKPLFEYFDTILTNT